MGEASIAIEVQFLEKFNTTKQRIETILQNQPPLTEFVEGDPIGDTQNAITHEIDQFQQNCPVPVAPETNALLHRFIGNYSHLELYKGVPLQAVNIIDHVLNLPATVEVSAIVDKLFPKLWDEKEAIGQWQERIGYYSFIRQIISAQSLHTATRERCVGFNEMLTTELYSFNEPELVLRLYKETTYKTQQQIALDTLNTHAGLSEAIHNFENYSQKNENLMQHVLAYAINMNRLRQLKGTFRVDIDNNIYLEEILKVDLFALIGDIIFDECVKVSLDDIESIVCHLNTNLLHVITTNTCPTISIRDKFSSTPNNDVNEILQLLTKDENTTDQIPIQLECATRKPFKIERHDIFEYVRQHNELMAYLLTKIHGYEPLPESHDKFPAFQLNCRILDNIMQMEELSIHLNTDAADVRMLTALKFDSFALDAIRVLIMQANYR